MRETMNCDTSALRSREEIGCSVLVYICFFSKALSVSGCAGSLSENVFRISNTKFYLLILDKLRLTQLISEFPRGGKLMYDSHCYSCSLCNLTIKTTSKVSV